ncbi:MAG TPA: hypothetical protein VGQ83_13145 [Polyangia bacterium]
MTTDRPARRRRRTTGFAPRVKGNELFTRCLEELEKHLSPRRAGEALVGALAQVGARPEDVTLGHLVRAVDLSLPQALAPHCEEAEAAEIAQELTQLLDVLAAQYFRG